MAAVPLSSGSERNRTYLVGDVKEHVKLFISTWVSATASWGREWRDAKNAPIDGDGPLAHNHGFGTVHSRLTWPIIQDGEGRGHREWNFVRATRLCGILDGLQMVPR